MRDGTHREPMHQSDDVDDDVFFGSFRCFLEATLARGKLTSTNLPAYKGVRVPWCDCNVSKHGDIFSRDVY